MARPKQKETASKLPSLVSDIGQSSAPTMYEGADYRHQERPNFSINESDLKLHLQQYEQSLKRKSNLRTYIGELLTVLVALTTATTKEMFYLPADVWTALFVFVGGYCAFQLARGFLGTISIRNAVSSGSLRQLFKRDTGDIDSVLENIRRDSFRNPRSG